MNSRLRGWVILLVMVCAVSAESSQVLWKVDESGKKVFYNTPSHAAAGTGELAAIYYSSKAEDYTRMIHESSDKYGVDPDLVKAVIQVESNFNHQAVSRKGAKGLMQLMPDTAARYGVQSLFDPSQNIEGGVHYLKDLMQLFNSDMRLALAAYNAGENRVQKINDVPNFTETQNYVRKILALYNGDVSYVPVSGTRIRNVSYWKYQDDKGVTHYSSEPVNTPNATKVSFSYAW